MLKKFLPILAALLFVVSISVASVSAATVNTLPEQLIELPRLNYDGDDYLVYSVGNQYFAKHFDVAPSGLTYKTTVRSDGAVLYTLDYVLPDEGYIRFDSFSAASSTSNWSLSKGEVIYSNNDDTFVSSTLNEIIIHYAPFDVIDQRTGELVYVAGCDGSSCPAIDLNIDGVCDECAMPLRLRLSGYPTLPSVDGDNVHKVVLQREDGYFFMALTSDTAYSISGSVEDVYLITIADEQEVSYTVYKCTDGQNWVHSNSGNAYSLSVGSSSSTLLESSFDWYKDGAIFFQVPLWVKAETITQGQMMGLTATTAGTMTTLVACGVGLIALLVVLILFGKVLRRYLLQ